MPKAKGPKTDTPTAADVEEKPAAAAAEGEEKPAAADAVDTPATVTEEEPMEKVEKNVNLDAAATVEELPGGPKAQIEVITSIQPLTKEEADSVLGTTESEYFKTTFRKTLAATNLTMVDDMVVKTAEPGKEFKWPQAPPGQKKKNKTAGIEELPEEVPLVSEPGVDNDTLLAPAVANTTVGVPAPATQRSSAAGATSSLAITVFAVVLGAVFAL
jgi:hypothetical protein